MSGFPVFLRFVGLALLVALCFTIGIGVIGWLDHWESAQPYVWALRFLAVILFLLGLFGLVTGRYTTWGSNRHRWGTGFATPTLLQLDGETPARPAKSPMDTVHLIDRKQATSRFFWLTCLVGIFLLGFSRVIQIIL